MYPPAQQILDTQLLAAEQADPSIGGGVILSPSTINDAPIARVSASAMSGLPGWRPAPPRSTCTTATTNSSLPSRATVSSAWMLATMRRAIDQHLVADVVAPGIVERAEIVQVDEHHRTMVAAAQAGLGRLLTRSASRRRFGSLVGTSCSTGW